MKERIAELLLSEGLSANKFAEIVGVQASGISHILSGRNKPGYDLIAKVLGCFPRISPDWLLLGTGSMYRDNDHASAGGDVVAHGDSSNEREPTLFNNDPVQNMSNQSHISSTTTTERPNSSRSMTYRHRADYPADSVRSRSNTFKELSGNSVVNVENLKQPAKAGNAEIERVMVFYSDNTVAVYTLK